jgi:hypothetical protein
MMGLVEEGQQKRKKTRPPISPLSAPYSVSSARNLAQQPQAEGDRTAAGKADQLLNQVARSLMSAAKVPAAVEQVTIDGAE